MVGVPGQVARFHWVLEEVVQLLVYRLLLEVPGVFVPFAPHALVFRNLWMVEEMLDEEVASPLRR